MNRRKWKKAYKKRHGINQMPKEKQEEIYINYLKQDLARCFYMQPEDIGVTVENIHGVWMYVAELNRKDGKL